MILQLGDDLQLDLQLEGDFATWFAATKMEFQLAKWHTCACRWFRSCETPCKISRGVSQLQNHPLAHEFHFAAPPPHFAAMKWAVKWPAKMFLGCEMAAKLSLGYEMASKL